MATRAEIEAKLAAIDQRKAEALKTLQARRARLKAKLAELSRPTKSQRRLDARRKILLGAFVLEQLEHAGIDPLALTFEGKRFGDWLLRPNDRAVFEAPTGEAKKPITSTRAPRIATTDTPLKVPFPENDQVKALGARWYKEQSVWVVPKGLDLEPFSAWLS
jgi:hypothetical protein